jgi:hypothetical protein
VTHFIRFIIPITLIVFAASGAFIGYYQGDSMLTRSGVFFLVTSVLIAELFAMIGRTPPGMWDSLAISMVFFRVALINYMASLFISFAAFAVYPEWWWTGSRIVLGVLAATGLFFMVREDVDAWQVMNRRDRLRASIYVIVYIIAIFGVAFIW